MVKGNIVKLYKGKKINSWTLVSKLGAGGNGEVWKCRNANNEFYAIKCFKYGRYSACYARFLDEVKFMEQYHNIHGVLPIIDKFLPTKNQRKVSPNIPLYYVMPLATPIDRIKQIPLDDRINVIRQLLHMLVTLHQNGIAHRDIKPANILFYNGEYVLSDFGLVYFNKKKFKTPHGTKLGAKRTISPQMERDASNADKFKADVYSMAKTIWMILTGDDFSFEGQYIANSEFGLSRKISCDKYLYPLDKLLAQSTDYSESSRPTAEELEQKFEEWIQINSNWHKENLMQWQEMQEQLFPTVIPVHAEWNDTEDIVAVLRLAGKYRSQNHMFFPDGGGLDLTGAAISYEKGCIELICESQVYIVKPRRLLFEYINEEIGWNYLFLETEKLQPVTSNLPSDFIMEEVCEVAPLQYKLLEILDNMTKSDYDMIKPRHICRYLEGSFVFFHKDSLYNHFVSQYKGEHYKLGAEKFRYVIMHIAENNRGMNMENVLQNNQVQEV